MWGGRQNDRGGGRKRSRRAAPETLAKCESRHRVGRGNKTEQYFPNPTLSNHKTTSSSVQSAISPVDIVMSLGKVYKPERNNGKET